MKVVLNLADGVALLADSWMVMAALVMKMETVTQRFGINISAKKSECLYVGSSESDVRVEDVQLRGQTMKTVGDFTYLGGVIACKRQVHIEHREEKSGSHQSVWHTKMSVL